MMASLPHKHPDTVTVGTVVSGQLSAQTRMNTCMVRSAEKIWSAPHTSLAQSQPLLAGILSSQNHLCFMYPGFAGNLKCMYSYDKSLPRVRQWVQNIKVDGISNNTLRHFIFHGHIYFWTTCKSITIAV